MRSKVSDYWAVAVAQLAERLLPIPEICGSNPVISKFLNCVEKTKIKKKRPRKGHFEAAQTYHTASNWDSNSQPSENESPPITTRPEFPSWHSTSVKKWDQFRTILCWFSSFQTNNTIFTTKICEKCPSSVRCWDSNSQPSENVSPRITTRPELPSWHFTSVCLSNWLFCICQWIVKIDVCFGFKRMRINKKRTGANVI